MTAKNKVDTKAITSDQLEEMFDDGDDILDYVDLDNPVVEHHPPLEKRITLTMPAWSALHRARHDRRQALDGDHDQARQAHTHHIRAPITQERGGIL